ncbi:MAG: F0F1 ATP synthase subunit B [Planctomycetales bacterium]|nr:F0F1 ATP synthase subunit B [Planctomycetales bacterium]NIM09782.1 F0F1 ATP synthase subunit B [Planctomycetales bacterium]NIN09251.1 F0F1 ATP synthase subunit B [Planctomycetales bacterium]NIN78351.1 F0F1 ATP synthase subunit B [Planctomycetales bacterium]NIO35530.1 F0F1 ATP synthase subunit B [Planctomycetales bacterium]
MNKLLFERVLFLGGFTLALLLLPRVAAAADPLAVDVDLAIWTAIVFLVTLAVLWKFAWGPICEGLERREQAIADNIATAENAAEEARKLTAEYEAKLAGAADEVRKVMEEARRDAEYTSQQIVEKAQAKAAEEGNRMLREVETAKDAALKEISDSAADLAVDLAGQIVGRELSVDDHSRLIEEAQSDFLSVQADGD